MGSFDLRCGRYRLIGYLAVLPDDLSEFIKVTNLHDDYRNESFATTFPEYWGLLNETN